MKVAPVPLRTPTATYTVNFEKQQRSRPMVAPAGAASRIPRVARLLALAHRIDGMIRGGVIKDWAEAAKLVGVTRARMTQIANLLLLAPEIQEMILMLPSVRNGDDSITERHLRALSVHIDWREQDIIWMSLRKQPKIALPA